MGAFDDPATLKRCADALERIATAIESLLKTSDIIQDEREDSFMLRDNEHFVNIEEEEERKKMKGEK